MNHRIAALLTCLFLAAHAAAAGAQIVRGTVTERTSSQAMAGVVITLERPPVTAQAQPQIVSSVLTNEAGQYAIRPPAPGRYRVSAKQIGVKRFTTGAFEIAAGETKRLDFALDAVTLTLPEVQIVASGENALCLLREGQAQRLASLWEEARTALTATQISLRDRLFRGRIARYVRELEPRNLRVLSESRADQAGILDRPFTSLSGDSLSRVGYWRRMRDSSLVFDAPDADVLMSAAFRRDHCFTVVEGGRDRRGLVGIAFEPHKGRAVPDIRGTFWLDARSFQLRLVDFRYTHLQTSGDSTRVGGEVHFARLASGAWVVRRWFIRMPQLAHYSNAPVGVDHRMPTVLVRPGIYRFIEEGGDIFAEGIRFFEKPASVVGTVLDSAGAPFPGVNVRLAGTPFTAPVDSLGRFHLDSLPPGRHTLIAEHERYAALGMPAGDEPLTLEEGETQRVTVRALTTADIVARLCDGRGPTPRRATLRLALVDSDNGGPLGAQAVWLHWTQPGVPATASDREKYPGLRSVTDAKGVVAFCDLPAGIGLQLEVVRADERSVAVAQLMLNQGEVAARTLRAKRVK